MDTIMIFETNYSKEQILSILSTYTKPYSFSYSTKSNILISNFAVLVWTLFCFAIYPISNNLLFYKQQKSVIDFLETHLKAERKT